MLKSRVMIDERPSLYQFKSVYFEEQMGLFSLFYYFLIIEVSFFCSSSYDYHT